MIVKKRKARVIWAVVDNGVDKGRLFVDGHIVKDVYRKKGVVRLESNEQWVKFKEVL